MGFFSSNAKHIWINILKFKCKTLILTDVLFIKVLCFALLSPEFWFSPCVFTNSISVSTKNRWCLSLMKMSRTTHISKCLHLQNDIHLCSYLYAYTLSMIINQWQICLYKFLCRLYLPNIYWAFNFLLCSRACQYPTYTFSGLTTKCIPTQLPYSWDFLWRPLQPVCKAGQIC